MFGWRRWRRYRAARAEAAAERTVRKLRGRAAIREAESIVEATWVDQLDRADQSDPMLSDLRERERSAFAAAMHRRAAEAEADQRRLAAIRAAMPEKTRMRPTG